jgi:hypothetical protein
LQSFAVVLQSFAILFSGFALFGHFTKNQCYGWRTQPVINTKSTQMKEASNCFVHQNVRLAATGRGLRVSRDSCATTAEKNRCYGSPRAKRVDKIFGEKLQRGAVRRSQAQPDAAWFLEAASSAKNRC